MVDETNERPFAETLQRIVQERGVTNRVGNVVWRQFADDLPTIHYETLRKMLSGERLLDLESLEEIAKAAEVDPAAFVEYRVLRARQLFDVREVGLDQAVANLRRLFPDRVPGRCEQA